MERVKPNYMYTPTAEQLICLTCPLPRCNAEGCKRYAEEYKKIKGVGRKQYGSIKRNAKKA